MKNGKIFKEIICVIFIVIFTLSIVPKTFQNDTFYSIKVGETIVSYGFDGLDHFSIHDGLGYTSPHWIFDTIISFLYNAFSLDGIYVFVLILACVQVLLLYFFMRKKGVSLLASLAGTLVITYLIRVNFTGRAQVISYSCFLIELFLLDKVVNKSKASIVGLFIISVIIANVHCAVWPFAIVLTLPYIAEYIYNRFRIVNVVDHSVKRNKRKLKKYKLKNNPKENKIKDLEESISDDEFFLETCKVKGDKKITINENISLKYLIIALIVIIIAGFCTPTGFYPFSYYVNTAMGDSLSAILEHQPIVIAQSIPFFIFIVIGVACIGFIDSKMRLSDGFLIIGLLFMTIISQRNEILLLLLGMPVFIKMIDDFVRKNMGSDLKNLDENKLNKSTGRLNTRVNICIVIVLIIAGVTAAYSFIGSLNENYIDDSSYPVEATNFINDYIDENEIDRDSFRMYNGYNYGSYLLLNDIPVFIDSRADLYCEEFNHGTTVFNDNIDLYTGTVSYNETFDKYDLDYALLDNGSLINVYMKDDENCEMLYSDDNFTFYKINREVDN